GQPVPGRVRGHGHGRAVGQPTAGDHARDIPLVPRGRLRADRGGPAPAPPCRDGEGVQPPPPPVGPAPSGSCPLGLARPVAGLPLKTVGISHTFSASMPVQPRCRISFSVLARRVSVTTNVPKALISSLANRSPAASRSTVSLASNAGGSRSAGSSSSCELLI